MQLLTYIPRPTLTPERNRPTQKLDQKKWGENNYIKFLTDGVDCQVNITSETHGKGTI